MTVPCALNPATGSAVSPASCDFARQTGGNSMSGSALASQIKEHMTVVGSDGGHVGTVDKLEEDRIKLTKQDDPGGRALHHHYLPVSAVAAVDGREVRLNMDADRAKELATMTGASEPTRGMGSASAG